MIPFENTIPYDEMMGDLFVEACPFCSKKHVLLPIKPAELQLIRDGKKRLLVFPCCHHRVTIINADQDYLLADRSMRSL